MSELVDKLENLAKSSRYPFHMPGHKRHMTGIFNPYQYDITEIEGFDDLADPQGILDSLLKDLAGMYRAKLAFLSLNGSTGSNMIAIFAATKQKDEVIVATNCHRSVFHALELREAIINPVMPKVSNDGYCESIRVEQIKDSLEEHPNAKLVILTSPTYEGIVSDIKAIADVVHNYGATLFVDSAHGAHFAFSEYFPEDAIHLGADAMSVSLHKTLPMPGQSSLLLIPEGSRIQENDIGHFWQILHTSSPSYLLMAMIANGMDWLKVNAKNEFVEYERQLDIFYQKARLWKCFSLMEQDNRDAGKLVIITTDSTMSGETLAKILLEKYAIDIELAAENYIIAMTSVMDTSEGFERLSQAMYELDGAEAKKTDRRK